MKINASLTALANALALVNDANPALNLTDAQVTLGVPQVRVPDANPRNTTLTLTAIPNAGYSGTVDVRYTRLGLDTGVQAVPTSVQILPSDSQAVIMGKITTALGLVASEVDFFYNDLPVDGENEIDIPVNEDDTSVQVTLRPAADSLLYVGEDLVITLSVPDEDIPLATAVENVDLDGFDPETGV